jgi:NAD(P)-dependent dehydrogenase (short-subunit alcohol dehydrogenase family)
VGLLEGKVAIVTGGARGIGRGEAMLLARQGASVVVNDLGGSRDGTGHDQSPAQLVVDEIAAFGGRAVANCDDVASWVGGSRLLQQAIETFGGLDILVCNAGIVRDRMVFNMSEEEWDAVLGVHLSGHFVPTRFATAYWREQAKMLGRSVGGRIVYTSSHAGLYGNEGQVNYSAAKAGILAMGLVVAREMARYGVTVNTICPGGRTRLSEATLANIANPPDEGFDQLDPDNVAPWVVYLCTDAAEHISGQTFSVVGGTVELLQGWQPVSRIERDGRWTVEELLGASNELFGDRSTQPRPLEISVHLN